MRGSIFLKNWKKAKPLLLLDTGISEMLRNLPDDPSQAQLKLYAKVGAELGKKMKEPRIKAEKSALDCLKDIQDTIVQRLLSIEETRKLVLDAMGRSDDGATRLVDELAGKARYIQARRDSEDAISWAMRLDRLTSDWNDEAIVPRDIERPYKAQREVMIRHSKAALDLLQAMEKDDKDPDLREQLLSLTRRFADCLRELQSLKKKLAALVDY